MRVEYKAKKENQDICIVVSITTGYGADEIRYSISDIGIKEKNQMVYRFKSQQIHNDYNYRKLNAEQRQEYIKQFIALYVSEEDILMAINYAFTQMKPNIKKLYYSF